MDRLLGPTDRLDPNVRPVRWPALRILTMSYRRNGLEKHRRVISFTYTVFSVGFAIIGSQLTRLFVPGLTRTDLLILTGLGVAIYLLDDVFAIAAIAPRLGTLQQWSATPGRADATEMWRVAADIPLAPLSRPLPLILIAVLNLVWIGVLMRLQHLPALALLLLIPGAIVFRFYWFVLRFTLTELMMRPVLADLSLRAADSSQSVPVRIKLSHRLFASIPLIAVTAGTVVAGIVGSHGVATMAIGVGVSTAVAVVVAGPIVLLVIRSITEPLTDLHDAADRVRAGDLGVRVPVTSTDEVSSLARSFNTMMGGLAERDRLRTAFGTYLDPSIVEHILASENEQLIDGEDVEVTALFMDVRGFTGYSERHAARDVVAMLNRLFATVVPIIGSHGGYVDKFIGDGLLAVFGVPRRFPDHADRALAAALEIADALRNRSPDPDVGIGLNSGSVVAGNLGGAGRFDFTVIGDPINVAARVESATRQTGDTILLSENTRRLLSEDARLGIAPRPAVPLKGKTEPIALYSPVG